jgi:hypothetical protein
LYIFEEFCQKYFSCCARVLVEKNCCIRPTSSEMVATP